MMPPEIPTPSSNPQTPVTYAHNATESGSSSAQSSIVSAQDDNITNGNTYDGFTGRALSSPRSRSPSSQPQFSVKEPEKEAVLPHKARTTSAPVNASPVVTFTASSLEQLKNLPPKRELPWRAGLELTDDYEFKRPQQKGAVFLAARGEVQSQPCRICENGNGRFTLCVALDQYFGGACASCVFPSKGSQCTLRKDKEDGIKKEVEDSPVAHLEPSKKRKRVSTAKVLESPGPVKKAKKPDLLPPVSDLIGTDIPLSHKSKPFEVQIPYETQRHEPHAVDLLNATYKKHKNDKIPSPPRPQHNSVSSTTNGLYSAHPYGQPTKPPAVTTHDGWTAVNSTRTPLPSSTPLSHSSVVNGSSSQSQARYQDAEVKKKQKMPLIDTFSKTEQRQVYGLIHGLQGGIEAMSKQLGTLKGLLGIEEDV